MPTTRLSPIGVGGEKLRITVLTRALQLFTTDESKEEATQEAWKQAQELAELLDQPWAPGTSEEHVAYAKAALLDFLALFSGEGSYAKMFDLAAQAHNQEQS